MYLVESRNICSLPEVSTGGRSTALAGFALDGKFRTSIAENDKIYLAFVGVADEAQFHVIPFGVFDIVAVLQQVSGYHVLKPGTAVCYARPVPEIQLLFLAYGSDPLGSIRWNAIAQVQPLYS